MSKKTKAFLVVGGVAALYEFLLKPVSLNFGLPLPDVDYSYVYDFVFGGF